MLIDAIVKMGKPVVESDLPVQERIRYLTDIENDQAKNFFSNIFVVEIIEQKATVERFSLTVEKDKKTIVSKDLAPSFPIILPAGGNPLHAQGFYPLPLYPLYDRHIKDFENYEKIYKIVLDRLKRTLPLQKWETVELETLCEKVVSALNSQSSKYIEDQKQLGILVIALENIQEIYWATEPKDKDDLLIRPSMQKNENIYFSGKQVIENIVETRFQEAKELGAEKEGVSTLAGKRTEVVSAYNKSWLWLSSTWEMPRSIYWSKKDWTKGIKLSREEYESFFYGTQVIKSLQTRLPNALLKEMFAPITNVEAKQHMQATNFDPVFGIPFILPLLDTNIDKQYKVLKSMKKTRADGESSEQDIDLERLGGMSGRRIVRQARDDEYRLMLLYYSGELGRGNVHIRSIIEDVVPSVAFKVQNILRSLQKRKIKEIVEAFNIQEGQERIYALRYLPSLLSNAYGPGYIWSSLQKILKRMPISLERVQSSMNYKLNELAKKNRKLQMKQELLFYHGFLYFYNQYNKKILNMQEGVMEMSDWMELMDKYHQSTLESKDMDTPEKLGFISGLALRQFSMSYWAKTNNEYLEHRVMKFGSKLTPENVWKQGLMRGEELKRQWDLGMATNYNYAVGLILLQFLEFDKVGLLKKEKDAFMTAFWSGYLMYKKVKEEQK